MALSNSTDFKTTAYDSCISALELIGVASEGRQASSYDVNRCMKRLNAMLKHWNGKGIHLWTRSEGVVFLTEGTASYDLGQGNIQFTNDTKFTTSLLAADTLAGVSSVVSAKAIIATPGDNLLILNGVGKTFHALVTSVVGTTINFDTPTTFDLNKEAVIHTYNSIAEKPLRILNARVVVPSFSSVSVPMINVPYESYKNIGMQYIGGNLPNQYTYTPKDLSTDLLVWPQPNNSGTIVQLTYERSIMDVDQLTNDLDLPAEWTDAIDYQLAVRIAPIFNKGARGQELLPIATALLNDMLDYDVEVTSLTVGADLR